MRIFSTYKDCESKTSHKLEIMRNEELSKILKRCRYQHTGSQEAETTKCVEGKSIRREKIRIRYHCRACISSKGRCRVIRGKIGETGAVKVCVPGSSRHRNWTSRWNCFSLSRHFSYFFPTAEDIMMGTKGI